MSQPTSKIVGGDLAKFAEGSGGGERSVIVELVHSGAPVKPSLKNRPLERYAGPHGPAESRPPARSRSSGSPAQAGSRAKRDAGQSAMDTLEAALRRHLKSRELVRLENAEAFVVFVTPEELRAVAAEPLVGWIRPNRTRGSSA